MKIVIFTGNQVRHKFVANTLAAAADEAFVVSEVQPHDSCRPAGDGSVSPAMLEHFGLRYEMERYVFAGHDAFHAPTIPLMYKEANLAAVVDVIRGYSADMCFVFGSSLLHESVIALGQPGRFVNCHLGLSPYYRGSGTNFWPWVNGELEYVGSTLLHLDPGVDTGDIICHVRPEIVVGDTVHSVGCKVIAASAAAMVRCMTIVRTGRALPRIPQWTVSDSRYYRAKDFDETTLTRYRAQLAGGLIERYTRLQRDPPRLVLPSMFAEAL